MSQTNQDIKMLELAEEMKQAYGKQYVGSRKPRVLKNILSRYETEQEDPSVEQRLFEFVRTRGPYLQALDLPRQGDKPWPQFADETDGWATDGGLDPDIVRTFRDAGIERLFEFQQRTIKHVLDDKHTLVTAGTGRGKTESWLIPILQFICEAKDGHHAPTYQKQGVKCILTYPTKALAQDQLKRLIEYLFNLNKNRTGTNRITIGIFDGDTPPNDPDALEYLETAFSFFECPCDHCSSSLTVERTDDGYVVTHDADTETDVDLSYITVTRDETIAAEVDILLTNPDTINYRLFNINEREEQNVFVTEPKYVVFDEIHEYSGLFGSFTAMLMRRYLRARQTLRDNDSLKDDDLRLVGASATVENKEAIFQRINPFADPDIEVVSEKPRKLSASLPSSVPEVYTKETFNAGELKDVATGGEPSDILGSLLEYTGHTVADLRETDRSPTRGIEEALYNNLLNGSDDALSFVRGLYDHLTEDPERPSELQTVVQDAVGLDSTAAETLVENFITIGQFSGVLESRAHLFSWPLDGYYTCLNCASVFPTPQSDCPVCDHHFVSKLTYCSHCGEEALESWYCPDCQQLRPLAVTSDGRLEYFQSQQCPCGSDRDLIKTVWRPYYECSDCSTKQKISRVSYCEECDAPMSPSVGSDDLHCTNPDCQATRTASDTVTCQNCHSEELEPLSDEEILYCNSCGESSEESDGHRCECGGDFVPKRYLGWSCNGADCDEVYLGHPPNTCDCGRRRFARTGLFDIDRVDHCSNCETDLFPGQQCDCDEPDIEEDIRGFSTYKMEDDKGAVRDASDFAGAVPCYDKGRSYSKGSRYNTMLRGPGNVAVTSSKYLLRSIADPEQPDSFHNSKVLSFADSQAAMKELARNFQEPEESLFYHQLVVEGIEQAKTEWVSLTTLQEYAVEEVETYKRTLQAGTESRGSISPLDRSEEYIRDEVAARVLRGRFNNRRRYADFLARNGLINVRLDVNIESLSRSKRRVLSEFEGQSKQYLSTLEDKVDHAGEVVEELIDNEVLRRIETDGGYLVGLNQEIVECTIPSETTPIAYDPEQESWATNFEIAVNRKDTSRYGDFASSIPDRADFEHPHFDRRAYQIEYSDPLLLLSDAYYGSTEKEERRRLEYRFREGRYPNFLSSGPAMEVGVDIGDLDSLLLYGTPPNKNSYLQRVGRAGRESGSSLVHSVSQRNPIDFYYFERPTELIKADAQPVPLNEANEEVFRVSLTWALLDCVAATTWLPWREDSNAMMTAVYIDGDPVSRSAPKPNEIKRFSELLASKNDVVQYGGEDAPLKAIEDWIEDNRSEVETWLRDLLRFGYCSKCGYKHTSGYKGACQVADCSGTVVDALDEHGHVIDTVLDKYDEELIQLHENFTGDLLDEIDEIEERISELELEVKEKKRRSRRIDDDELLEMEEELQRLKNRRTQLHTHLDTVDETDLGEFINDYSATPIGMRSVSDKITYDLVGEGYQSVTDEFLSRGIQTALSELHPGAAYLHSDGDHYVVTQIDLDSYQTAEIQEDVETAAICPVCASEYELGTGTCEACGTDLMQLDTVVPNHIIAQRSDLYLGDLPNGDTLTPERVYRDDSSEIESTYAPAEDDIASFTPDPSRTFEIVDDSGDTVGVFSHGDVTVRSSVGHFWASYKGGGTDPLPNVFELCGKCDGVVASDEETAYCVQNPEHPMDDNRAVKLATEFDTKAVRIQLNDDEEVEHTFAHGLRVALQYIGGVSVRQVPESVETEGSYVYDGDEGGGGITVLLTEEGPDAGTKFEKAVDIMQKAFGCDCDDGCPFCIYQYGCTNRNDPSTFNKEQVMELIDGGLSLAPVTIDETALSDDKTDISELILSDE